MQLSSGCMNEGSLNGERRGSYTLENGRLHMCSSSPHTYTAFPVLQLTSHCVFCSHVVIALFYATFGTWRLYKSVF